MYVPKHFEVKDEEEIFSFVEANAFGQLISSLDGRPFSTHMPFLVSADKTQLIGHLARQNPQHTQIDGQDVLITLQGPHHYISPSWYTAPGVPTWNYQTVHIYGICSVFDEPNRIKRVVNELTEKYESAQPEPWQPDYKASMINAIKGIEISITEIQCKFKLSQNRPVADKEKVIAALKSSGSIELALAMENLDD